MNDVSMTVKQSLDERHLQNDESWSPNQADLRSSKKEIRMAKRDPIHPTPLEYSWFTTHRRTAAVCAYVLFTILAATIGILIVCFTSLKPKVPRCDFHLRPTVQYSIRDSSHPQSVAVADFNKDGRMDIVIANSGFDNISIHLGYDNNTFANPITYSMNIGSTPRIVAAGDFNNDTLYDVVVANFGTNNIMILFSDGNGSFSNQKLIETSPSRPVYVVVADFNTDHCSDIAFVGYGTDSIGVLLGFCNGTFAIPLYFSTGHDSFSSSIAVGDFDNDNRLDIVVSNYGTDNVGLFFGYGNGTFRNQITYTTNSRSGPYSIAISDLNNDSHVDIAVVCSRLNNIGIFSGHGNGTFTKSRLFPTGRNSNPIFLATADFNNDNATDIIVANNGTDSMLLFLAYGDGAFAKPVRYPTGPRSSPCFIAIADFNSDNRLDIAIANQQNNNIKIFETITEQVLSNQLVFHTINNDTSMGLSFLSTGIEFRPSSVAMGDFNSDGHLDIAAASYISDCIYVFLADDDGRFLLPTIYSTGYDSSPYSIIAAHFNNDSELDIAVANNGADNIGIFLGYGDGEFSPQITYFTGSDSAPIALVAGDFNNDGRIDIAIANSGSSNNLGIFLRLDNDQFSSQITYFIGTYTGLWSLAVNDFNHDGCLDIAMVNSETINLGILLGYGNGEFSSPRIHFTGSYSTPRSITTADFNNDNRTDIAIANRFINNIDVLLAHSMQELSSQTSYSSGIDSGPRSIVAADFNNDGQQDIVIANYHADNIAVFLGSHTGDFSFQATYSTGTHSGPICIVSGDINNDGQLDLVVANFHSDNVGVFLGSNAGEFLPQMTYFTGANSGPTSIVCGDFNNDGRLDIAVANSLADRVGIFLASDTGSFSFQSAFPMDTDSSPICIVSGDFNSDGQLDLAVGNNGTNNVVIIFGYGNGDFSPLKHYLNGIDSEATSIVTDDFNNDGRLDLAIATYHTGSITIFLGYTNDQFLYQTTYFIGNYSCPMSLIAIDYNKDGRLDIAFAKFCRDNIGILLGDGRGAFLPRITYSTGAGSAPAAIVVSDLNNDGQLDIAVANYHMDNMGVFLSYKIPGFSPKITYPTGNNSVPNSLASGDFNNDGWLDIVVANSGTGNVGLFLGKGNNEFSPQITYFTGINSNPCSLVVEDFNHDSLLDIAVANLGTNSFGILLGNGNGTFLPQTVYSTGINSRPLGIVTSDFNNDGQLDIAIANHYSNNVGVFLGYDNGNFSSPTTYFTGTDSGPGSLTTGDLNNDGKTDIIVANYRSNNVGILLGNNNGRFATQKTYSTGDGSGPYSVIIVDLNSDGYLDIIVVNYLTNNIGIFLGHGNGNLSPQATFPTGDNSHPSSLVAGDCNNDGRPDIFVTYYGKNSVAVFQEYRNGKFSSQTTYQIEHGNNPCAIIVGDFNNIGRLDVAIANCKGNNLGLIFGHSTRLFLPDKSYDISANSRPKSIAVCDFNNDGQLDIAIVNDNEIKLNILLGYGTGEFSIKTTHFTSTDVNPHSIAVGDFNNDGRKDIVVANYHTDNVLVLLGNGTGDFSTQMIYFTGNNSSPTAIVTGDFNNDGRLDIAVANYQSDNICIFFGYGNGEFLSPISFSTGSNSGPHSIIASDFNRDGLLDIAVANYRTNNVGILLGNGKGQFLAQTTYSTGSDTGPYALAAGDLNNDGQLDIAVANYRANNIAVFYGYVNGQFSSQTIYSTGDGSCPSSIIITDLNKDGRLDIAVANYGTNNVGVLLAYGNGSFSPQTTYSTGADSDPVAIVAGDLNRDGRPDIAVANYGTKKLKIFLGFGTVEFTQQATYPTDNRSEPCSIVANDLNNDGSMDIAVANIGTDNLGIFLGDGNGHFSPQMTYFMGSSSRPCSLTITDFNNDKQLDIVVANIETSTIALLRNQGISHFPYITYSYKESICSMRVAVGDFNNDGQLDLVVANYGADSVGVLLGHGNGSFASPSVLLTGNSSSPISIAVGDINGDHQLDIAVANLHTSNIGIFFGYGNGSFKSLLVFSTGNKSCPISLAVNDLNSDDRFDIVIADPCMQNIVILLDYKDEMFSSQIIQPTPTDFAPIWVEIADINNDSRLDIAAVSDIAQSVGVLLASDHEGFQSWKMFSTGTFVNPVSLAFGDFNNDGDIDIAVIASQSSEGHVLILLGDGNGNFYNKGRYFTDSLSRLCSMAVGRWNKDNYLDIVVFNNNTRMIQIFLGEGDGSFSRERNYSTNGNLYPISGVVGDFNKDNLTDLAVADYGTYAVEIFLAHIDTNFIDHTMFFNGSAAYPRSIALGDFTNNGRIDIIVGNDGTHDISILINDGNGKFSMQNVYSGDSTFYPTSIIVSDFNNDQRLDVAVANSDMSTLTLLYGGGGDSIFDNSMTFFTENNFNPQSIAVGDFNNDNRKDITVAYSGIGSVGFFLRIDNGALLRSETLSTGSDSKPYGLTVADFDSDNQLDIAVANSGIASVGFFFGLGNGTFSEQKLISIGENMYPTWIGFGDFNNDKRFDVIATSAFGLSPMVVLLSNGNRSFRLEKIDSIYQASMGAVGDFNRDGDLDVVVCIASDDAIAVLLGYGNGTFRNPIIYSTGGGSYPLSVTVGDFNHDSRLDIAVGNTNRWNVGVFLGHGNGTFSRQTTYLTGPPANIISLTTEDFNNDGNIDIAVCFVRTNVIGILFGYGDGTFRSLVTFPTAHGSLRQSINAGDFNNDGQLDIITTDVDGDRLGILLGHINGTFFNEISYFIGDNSRPHAIGLGDFNNDGRLDVAVSNTLNVNIGIFLGYANEDFVSTAARHIGDSSQPVSIAVGDFDNDTCLDVVVADRGTSQIVIIQGSGYGTFSDHQIAYFTGDDSNPNWVAVEDFNQDQRLDIVVVNTNTHNIGVFLGFGDGTFSNIVTSPTGDYSSPTSISVGRFNNDNNLDIAVANSGSNNICILFGYGNGSFGEAVCRTSGYDSRPIAVASGDVNEDNMTDVVIANRGSSTVEILTKIC